MVETAPKSLRHSCRSNLPDKEFATLGPYSYGRRLPGLGFRASLSLTIRVTFRTGSVRPYTSPCGLAESCVFDKQSLGPFRCDPRTLQTRSPSPAGALLLPKLRSHFAEFLNHGSPDRLGMLYPPTCVGFGTGADAPP